MKNEKNKKCVGTTLSLWLCGLVVANAIFSPYNVKALDINIPGKISISSVQVMEKAWSEKLSLKEKCLSSGLKTAKETNELKNNKSKFEKRVRAILNEYYSTSKIHRNELNSFKKYIDDSAKYIVEHYEEAEAERNNQENLDYETGKVIVSFPHDTSMETIEHTMKKQALDYEIIDDGNVHIAENLPDYKKKRLQAIEDWESDIIVEAEISLEDTVERAEKKFEKKKHIKAVCKNNYFKSNGTIKTSYASATTNDDYFNENIQWNLKNVDVPRAWKRFDQKDIEYIYEVWVAVIDSGVQMNHKDLKAVLMRDLSVDITQNKKKLVNCKPDTSASNTRQYTEAHGTNVAGVLAGTVAMMMSIHYGLSPAQILSRLQSRATKTVKGRKNTNKTFKVLDAGNIVELMEAN